MVFEEIFLHLLHSLVWETKLCFKSLKIQYVWCDSTSFFAKSYSNTLKICFTVFIFKDGYFTLLYPVLLYVYYFVRFLDYCYSLLNYTWVLGSILYSFFDVLSPKHSCAKNTSIFSSIKDCKSSVTWFVESH